ncbi:uncharacterized protein LOC105420460 [Amborella trichopoda]|uniref:uncharacterized protein LOC105420460 n=1 Tax=Amborella trichopoda TaxID=13333 RepID=UPI0005D2D5A1|nr:uncharacterized protein LOC105420460 [Amborella trichopoda]|eukprot:XP_011622426.1 uncharacterized protein LOC105420460 [Amborella trichopoda]
MSKLDRFFIAANWAEVFPLVSVKSLVRLSFDHLPMLLNTRRLKGSLKPSIFKLNWLENQEVVELIRRTWSSTMIFGSLDYQIYKKLLNIKHKLLEWKKENHMDFRAKIDGILAEIEMMDLNVQESGVLTDQLVWEHSLKVKELEEAWRAEDLDWTQRSSNKWLKECDHNTKLFHAITSIRRRQNDISGLSIPRIDPDDSEAMGVGVI